jgi:integrase
MAKDQTNMATEFKRQYRYTLYKRDGSPFWWVSLGRAARESTKTENEDDAHTYAKALEERLWRVNTLGDRSAVPFETVAKKWLKSPTKRGKLPDDARGRDKQFLPWIYKHIGQDSVGEIVSDPDVLDTLQDLGLAEGLVAGRGWSHGTVDRMMTTVASVLNYAVLKKYITGEIAVPMFREKRPEPEWWTPPQYAALVSQFNDIRQELTSRFALNSILRMRSMLRMQKDRIDLEARTAWVPGYQSKSGEPIPYPLSWELVYITKELLKLNPDGPNLFQYEGQPIDNCNTAAFRAAMQRAGLEGNWHTHRHTGATWLLKFARATLEELMELGGWHSYQSVLIYRHHLVEQGQAVADRLGATAASALRGVDTWAGASSWAVTDSNRGPMPCKGIALPAELTAPREPGRAVARAQSVHSDQRHLVGPDDKNSSRIILLDDDFRRAAPRDVRLVRTNEAKTIKDLGARRRTKKPATGG